MRYFGCFIRGLWLGGMVLLAEVPNPDVVAGQWERGAQQGGQQPQDAGEDAAEGAGVDGVNPAAKLVGGVGGD